MKFIAKSSNLLVVLSPGLPAQPITGTPAKPTVSVRFKDGLAEVTNEEMVEMMLNHPSFNTDFISAEEIAIDPYASQRKANEPTHIITELQHGTPMGRTVGGKPEVSPELKKIITDSATELAKEMVKEMLPTLVAAALKGQSAESQPEEESAKTEKDESVKAANKPGPGRRPKQEKEVDVPAPISSEGVE